MTNEQVEKLMEALATLDTGITELVTAIDGLGSKIKEVLEDTGDQIVAAVEDVEGAVRGNGTGD